MNNHRPRAVACACALLVSLAFLWNSAPAANGPAEPLHRRIDRLLAADRIGPAVAPASDAEFLRRVALDLTGMPPSAEELRRFLADKDPDKRVRAVDRLLESPLFARHWATTLDVMLMERLPNDQVPAEDWQAFLLDAARRNRPFNELVAEILRADGVDPKHRAPARFYLDRESEPNRITRDVGRIFFGLDLQCAQCHNHPLVEDYRQSDYQGLLAFFSAGSEVVKMTGTKKTSSFPEKAGKDLAFDSVFVKDDHHLTGPRLPGGVELEEPVFRPGDEYKAKAAGDVMPVPRHSRRAMLASLAAGGGHRVFNENLANRLWAMMMGRGLVHPVDMNHPANPPSHPELLTMLGQEIAALQFDVKPFLRELALTKAYQSAIDLPDRVSPLPASFAAELAELKSRAAPMEAAAERDKEEYRKAEKAWHRAEAVLLPLVADEEKAVARHAAAAKKEEAARTALSSAETAAAARRETARALTDVAGRTQDLVKKLPKDKDLAGAARVFADRSTAAASELAALEKASGEKAAALKKIGEERAAVERIVESARAKLRQVRESVRREEAVALETRRKLAGSRAALENHQRRLAALEAYARWHGVRQQIDANRREAEALQPALVEAEKQSADQASVVQAREGEAKATEASRLTADRTRADADAALEGRRKIIASVDAALAATQAAQALLPGDPALGEAAQKLKEKTDDLRASLVGFQARVDAARSASRAAATVAKAATESLHAAGVEMRRREQSVRAARDRIAAAKARGDALRTELAEAADELTNLLGSRFAMAQLKPLTAEQMYWSIVKVTGVYDRTRAAQEAELDKAKPLAGTAANDPAARRARAIEVEQKTYDKLKSDVRAFVRMYGAGPGQPQNDFFATADQALFVSNGGSINGWLAPSDGNVSQRMVAENDPSKAAEDLYLTVLSRPPTADESADVARMFSVPAKDKPAVVQELVWGLLTSAEFRFNH
jgi:Protein of unknown function (DUF1549)/Protein of unknown function (DUF1553)